VCVKINKEVYVLKHLINLENSILLEYVINPAQTTLKNCDIIFSKDNPRKSLFLLKMTPLTIVMCGPILDLDSFSSQKFHLNLS